MNEIPDVLIGLAFGWAGLAVLAAWFDRWDIGSFLLLLALWTLAVGVVT